MAKRKGSLMEISTRSNFLLNLFFIAIGLTIIVPFWLVLSISFSNETRIVREGFGLLPKGFTLAAYDVLLRRSRDVINGYFVTIFQTGVGTFLTVLNTALYAYPLSRKDFRYRGFFSFFMFFTMLFSGGLVPWYLVCTRLLHLRDSLWALVIPAMFSPWWAIIMRTFYKTTIPEEMLDSAKIDGAGEYRTFFQIVLPLSLPCVATMALFVGVGFWNDWWLSLLFINTPSKRSMQYVLQSSLNAVEIIKRLSLQYGAIDTSTVVMPSETAKMAMAVLAIGPMLFIYPFVQKYFVKGMTIGSIKG